MKPSIIILTVLFFSQYCFSQTSGIISDKELESLKLEIENELFDIQSKLESIDYLSAFEKEILIEFQCDTFRIERMLFKRMELDYSTNGMVLAMYDAEIQYDQLLNKYYKKLMHQLLEPDREILKRSQRNWVKFRDSEREFNQVISKPEYSGGGTIQQLFVADKYLQITRKRVFELNEYLTRFTGLE